MKPHTKQQKKRGGGGGKIILKLSQIQCILIPPRVLYSYGNHATLAHIISLLLPNRIFTFHIHIFVGLYLGFQCNSNRQLYY